MSQTEVPTDDVGQRRRYRWLFGFEWILLVLTVAGFTLIPKVPADWPRIALGYVLVFLCMWHIVVIPICFFYLIGNPIVIVSPSRKFRKQLEQRPKLNDDEFYARFYEGSASPGNTDPRSALFVGHLLHGRSGYPDGFGLATRGRTRL